MTALHALSETQLTLEIESLLSGDCTACAAHFHVRAASLSDDRWQTLCDRMLLWVKNDRARIYRCRNRDLVLLMGQDGPETQEALQEIGDIFGEEPTPEGTAYSVYRTKPRLREFLGRLRAQAVSRTAAARKGSPAAQRAMRSQPCVLVVEDQRVIRHMLVASLDKHLRVLGAGDGEEALQLYETLAPDLVFLDVELPGIDGFDVLDRILTSDPEALVVMLTGRQTRNDVTRAMAAGARGYIVKPFTRRKLREYTAQLQPAAAQAARHGAVAP